MVIWAGGLFSKLYLQCVHFMGGMYLQYVDFMAYTMGNRVPSMCTFYVFTMGDVPWQVYKYLSDMAVKQNVILMIM